MVSNECMIKLYLALTMPFVSMADFLLHNKNNLLAIISYSTTLSQNSIKLTQGIYKQLLSTCAIFPLNYHSLGRI